LWWLRLPAWCAQDTQAFRGFAPGGLGALTILPAGLGDLDSDVGGFDGGGREHARLQAEFIGGLAAQGVVATPSRPEASLIRNASILRP
jgi:hypothetical protein